MRGVIGGGDLTERLTRTGNAAGKKRIGAGDLEIVKIDQGIGTRRRSAKLTLTGAFDGEGVRPGGGYLKHIGGVRIEGGGTDSKAARPPSGRICSRAGGEAAVAGDFSVVEVKAGAVAHARRDRGLETQSIGASVGEVHHLTDRAVGLNEKRLRTGRRIGWITQSPPRSRSVKQVHGTKRRTTPAIVEGPERRVPTRVAVSHRDRIVDRETGDRRHGCGVVEALIAVFLADEVISGIGGQHQRSSRKLAIDIFICGCALGAYARLRNRVAVRVQNPKIVRLVVAGDHPAAKLINSNGTAAHGKPAADRIPERVSRSRQTGGAKIPRIGRCHRRVNARRAGEGPGRTGRIGLHLTRCQGGRLKAAVGENNVRLRAGGIAAGIIHRRATAPEKVVHRIRRGHVGRAIGVVEVIVHERQRAGGRAVGVVILIFVNRAHPRTHRGVAEHRAENIGGAQSAQDVPAQPGSGRVAAVCAVIINNLPVRCVVGVSLQQHVHVVPIVGKTEVPHFVFMFDNHAQVGVQRRINRVGLRRGVGIDAIRAIADEVGHIGEIIIRRLHRQAHVEILAAFVGQHHHLFPVTLVANVEMGGIGWLLGRPIVPFSIGVSVQDEPQKGVTLEGRLHRRVKIGTQRTRIGAAGTDGSHQLHIRNAGVGGVRGIAA